MSKPTDAHDRPKSDVDALFYPVIIIGAGVSGIAAGYHLKEKLGLKHFKIFDKLDGIGGTWWSHRYPGVACDIPAPLYSFSFAQNLNWSTFKPPGEEIRNYLLDVCRKFRLVDHVQLRTEVTDLRWIEDEQLWEGIARKVVRGLDTSETRNENPEKTKKVTIRAKVVLSAVGKLTVPKFSAIQGLPGIERFEGNVIHTARWDDSIDLNGKDVIVLGSGCSAAQLVPSLISPEINAKSVTQLIRSPPWVTPDVLSGKSLRMWENCMPMMMRSVPGLSHIVRAVLFAFTERSYFLLFRPTSSASVNRAKRKGVLLKYMEQTVPAKYHEMLRPGYEVGCKRLIYDAGWFNSLRCPCINLYTSSLESIGKDSITVETADGQKSNLRADAIVLATGYDTSSLLHGLSVTGRDGAVLHDVWEQRGGPQAYMGVAMDKFPNFFMFFGPNSSYAHTGVIIGIENSIQYAMQFIKPIVAGDVSSSEVKEGACKRWTQMVQDASRDSVWTNGGCRNWYVSEKGWNATIYPWSQVYATYRAMFPVWTDWATIYTPEGLSRMKRQRTLGLTLVLSLCLLLISCCSGYIYHLQA